MPGTLGERFPELARELGVEPIEVEPLVSGAIAGVVVTTFTEKEGKRDLIGYVPPAYTAFGYLDARFAGRVKSGETWIVRSRGAVPSMTLLPLVRLDLETILALGSEAVERLASGVARTNPALARELLQRHVPLDPDREARVDALRQELDSLRAAVATERANGAAAVTRAEAAEAEATAARASALQRASEVAILRAKLTLATDPAAAQPSSDPRSTAVHPLPNSEGALVARRISADLLESPALTHEAYEVFWTLDLKRVMLKPSRRGLACIDGRVRVPMLSRYDPRPPPRTYPLSWDERTSSFVVILDR